LPEFEEGSECATVFPSRSSIEPIAGLSTCVISHSLYPKLPPSPSTWMPNGTAFARLTANGTVPVENPARWSRSERIASTCAA
jgi:hypothetical protein